MRKYLEWWYDSLEATRCRYSSPIPYHVWPDLTCVPTAQGLSRPAGITGPLNDSWTPSDDLDDPAWYAAFERVVKRHPQYLNDVDPHA